MCEWLLLLCFRPLRGGWHHQGLVWRPKGGGQGRCFPCRWAVGVPGLTWHWFFLRVEGSCPVCLPNSCGLQCPGTALLSTPLHPLLLAAACGPGPLAPPPEVGVRRAGLSLSLCWPTEEADGGEQARIPVTWGPGAVYTPGQVTLALFARTLCMERGSRSCPLAWLCREANVESPCRVLSALEDGATSVVRGAVIAVSGATPSPGESTALRVARPTRPACLCLCGQRHVSSLSVWGPGPVVFLVRMLCGPAMEHLSQAVLLSPCPSLEASGLFLSFEEAAVYPLVPTACLFVITGRVCTCWVHWTCALPSARHPRVPGRVAGAPCWASLGMRMLAGGRHCPCLKLWAGFSH